MSNDNKSLAAINQYTLLFCVSLNKNKMKIKIRLYTWKSIIFIFAFLPSWLSKHPLGILKYKYKNPNSN